MLQELLACELGVEVGSYFHSATSLHLYERHFKLAEEILAEPENSSSPMDSMTSIDELPRFLHCEESLRSGIPLAEVAGADDLTDYWRLLLEPLEGYRRRRCGDRQATQ
jgi:thymidylate synthase